MPLRMGPHQGHTATPSPANRTTPYSGNTKPSPPSSKASRPVTDLPIGTKYHYRLIASNEKGATRRGADQTAFTTAPPQIEAFSSSDVTATSAVLHAKINPQGFPDHLPLRIRHHHRLRPDRPQPEAEITARRRLRPPRRRRSRSHRRPPARRHLPLPPRRRKPTGAPSPPKTRASNSSPPPAPTPLSASRPAPPTSPTAAPTSSSPRQRQRHPPLPRRPQHRPGHQPSRFSFTGAFSSLPGAKPIDTAGDLYVATRTDTGWVTHYIGLPGNEAGCMGGPPNDPAPTPRLTIRRRSRTRSSPTPP